MKRLTPDSTWWHRVPHREITRSVAQREGGCGIGSWGFLEGRCLRMADYVRGPEGHLGGDR